MLYFAAHSGFAILDVSLPVNGVVGNPGQPSRAAVDTVFDGGKMRVVFDLIPFFYSQICAVPVGNFIVLPQQFCRHSDVMDIGWCGFHRMDKAAARVHAGVALHAEMPLIALSGL